MTWQKPSRRASNWPARSKALDSRHGLINRYESFALSAKQHGVNWALCPMMQQEEI